MNNHEKSKGAKPPSRDEVNVLRNEKAQIAAEVSELRSRGASLAARLIRAGVQDYVACW